MRGNSQTPVVRPTTSRCAGVSLLELLVTLGVIALLMSLIAPAVQSSREAARRLDCQHRLRQVALALHNFEHNHLHLPAPLNPRPAAPAIPAALSVFAHLLPELDQAPLFAKLQSDPSEHGVGLYPGPPRLMRAEHNELLRTRLAVVLCPSDNVPDGGCSFRACQGTLPLPRKDPSHPEDGGRRGVFPHRLQKNPQRLSEVTDGLSNTLMFPEKLCGDQEPQRYAPHRDTYFLLPATELSNLQTPDDVAAACASSFVLPLYGEMSYGGAAWLVAGNPYTEYNHILPPNSPINDCSAQQYFLNYAAVTARSWHPGGVNGALADGSVRFFSEAIDLRVWRALGTRAGGETDVSF